ncbi:MAG: hypothetical protein F7C35_06695, partial [Desulfurococcales archaeon]|nr:hypothetical protein [Desulfurococcales archaeon]
MSAYVILYGLTLSSTEDLYKFLSTGLLIITVGLGIISIYNMCPYYCPRKQCPDLQISCHDNNDNIIWTIDHSILNSFIFFIFVLIVISLLIPELRDIHNFLQLLVASGTLLMAYSVAVQAIDIRKQVYISRKQSEDISKQTRLMYETLRLDSAVKTGEILAYLWRKFITLYHEGINYYDYGIMCHEQNLSNVQLNININTVKLIESLNYFKDIIFRLERYN